MEKRKHPRSHVSLNVELAFPGGRTRSATTRDLSIGGFFVEL
ncbi:PilZ domain-containing protein [Sulfuricaulis sp.]